MQNAYSEWARSSMEGLGPINSIQQLTVFLNESNQ